jgi:phospholipid/cholesterol/gamma-HCH transport system substrate-binding protein
MTKEQKIRLGVFLMVASVLLVVILAVLIIPKLREEGEIYYTNFENTSVNGLYVGSPVKFQGVEVGKVSEIKVNPYDLNLILIQMKIRQEFPVNKDMDATLMYAGITGQRFIHLSGGTKESEPLPPRGEIPTRRGLGEKAEDIVANIDNTLQSINELLNPENQRRITQFLENTEKSSEIISDVLEKRKESVENAIGNIEGASQNFGEITANLYNVLQNLTVITNRIETSTEETFANISDRFSGEEMGQLIKNLEVFVGTVTDSVQKIQNLIIQQQAEMSQTFVDLRAVIANLSTLSRDLVEDPTMLIRTRRGKGK